MPPFAEIRPEHFAPALAVATARHVAEVAAIATDPSPPDFDNTIGALESSGSLLDGIFRVLLNLVAGIGGDELEAVDEKMAPALARHSSSVCLDPALFSRIAAVHAARAEAGLDPDQLRLLEAVHDGLVRSGASLPSAERARMAEVTEELAVLYTTFRQNVIGDEREWFLPLSPSDMDGLPDFLVRSLRSAAEDRGLDGHGVALSRSIVDPFLQLCPRADLRLAVWTAWKGRGHHPGPRDNRPLVPRILALRDEKARLLRRDLGYRNYAELCYADTMTGSVAEARRLLMEGWGPACRKAKAEAARLLVAARAEGFEGDLRPCDWAYWSEKARSQDHGIDEAELKPYFELGRMQKAAFEAASRLFGVEFVERTDIAAYHPDVKVFEVRDADGHVGVFLSDNFARPGKASGAWMEVLRPQKTHGGVESPIVVNCNNLARAEPTLLSFDDVRTLFHELGHGLHGLLSRVRYASQSGTSVPGDFVEFPSQVFEHWAELPETLRKWAVRSDTGEAIPLETITKLLAARAFDQGARAVEYLAAALIDLELHSMPDPGSIEAESFEREFLERIGMPPELSIRHRLAHFTHLFTGDEYAAGYPFYWLAGVYDADGFAVFKEAGDPFDPVAAANLKGIFAAGDSEDPAVAFRRLRGRAPDSAALLRQRSLDAA
jgi:peptidyl-dipeptidase Dcp